MIVVQNYYCCKDYWTYDLDTRRLSDPVDQRSLELTEVITRGHFRNVDNELLVLYREEDEAPLRLLLKDRVYDFDQLTFGVKQIADISRFAYELRYIRETTVRYCGKEIYKRQYTNVVPESFFDEYPEDFDFYAYLTLLSKDERRKKIMYTAQECLRTREYLRRLKAEKDNSAQ